MAQKLQTDWSTGSTVYALILNTDGQYWNGTAFETFNAANWANYDVALTEDAGTGNFSGNVPALAAGLYKVQYRERAGATPAVADTIAGDEWLDWTGTAIAGISGGALPELAQGIPAATPTLLQAVMLLYMALRNRVDTTATILEIFNDAGTVIAKSTLTESGSEFTRAKLASGP